MVTFIPRGIVPQVFYFKDDSVGEVIYKVEVKFVKEMPKDKQEGILYISKEYGTSIHLCPCGCGKQAVTPLEPGIQPRWKLTENGDLVTLSPSILNRFECKSHYWIRDNNIVWC